MPHCQCLDRTLAPSGTSTIEKIVHVIFLLLTHLAVLLPPALAADVVHLAVEDVVGECRAGRWPSTGATAGRRARASWLTSGAPGIPRPASGGAYCWRPSCVFGHGHPPPGLGGACAGQAPLRAGAVVRRSGRQAQTECACARARVAAAPTHQTHVGPTRRTAGGL